MNSQEKERGSEHLIKEKREFADKIPRSMHIAASYYPNSEVSICRFATLGRSKTRALTSRFSTEEFCLLPFAFGVEDVETEYRVKLDSSNFRLIGSHR